jgi:hypothetical protein
MDPKVGHFIIDNSSCYVLNDPDQQISVKTWASAARNSNFAMNGMPNV